MKLTRLGALAGSAILVLGACGTNTAAAPTAIKIAIELPLQGSEKAASQPIINGIRLAVKQAGGAAGGYTITVPDSAIFDDALASSGAHDPQTGANNMTKIVADETYAAVIGPLNSNVAKVQIPISNAAGLLQCSPANTNTDLTKGAPAAQLRTKPNNYIRVVTTDDIQGPAAALYIYNTLKKKSVYIIDDTEVFGKGVAARLREGVHGRGRHRRQARRGPQDHPGLRLDHDGRQGPQPRVHLLRRRDRDRRRAHPPGGRAGRPRRHPVCRP